MSPFPAVVVYTSVYHPCPRCTFAPRLSLAEVALPVFLYACCCLRAEAPSLRHPPSPLAACVFVCFVRVGLCVRACTVFNNQRTSEAMLPGILEELDGIGRAVLPNLPPT